MGSSVRAANEGAEMAPPEVSWQKSPGTPEGDGVVRNKGSCQGTVGLSMGFAGGKFAAPEHCLIQPPWHRQQHLKPRR